MKHLILAVLEIVIPQFRLDLHRSCHGISHWSRVWYNARFLCEAMNMDPTVPCLFSYLHDSCRFNDSFDRDHGKRAVDWVTSLWHDKRLPLVSPVQMVQLLMAMEYHSDGETEAAPVIQICWDADRLDLGRTGVRPDVRYLCTEIAKTPNVIELAWQRSIGSKMQR